MESTKLPPLMEYFANIEAPRRETKNKKYPLIEVIVGAKVPPKLSSLPDHGYTIYVVSDAWSPNSPSVP